jgi:hypothetical protein
MIPLTRNIFDNSVKLPIGKSRTISIDENDAMAKLKKLKIKLNKPHLEDGTNIKDSLFIELDKSSAPHEQLSYYFCSETANINKRTDLVIYHEKQDYLAILICDLKSSPAGCSDDRAIKQFKNSQLFLKYVNSLCTEHFQKTKPVKFFNISFFPMIPLAISTTIGQQEIKAYEENDEINKYPVNTDSSGEGVLFWDEILKGLP